MPTDNFLKTITTIHIFLCVGLIAFTFFTIYQSDGFVIDTESKDIMLYIVPILALAGYFGSQLLFKNKISAIKPQSEIALKLAQYQSALILKFACIEAPAFFALIIFSQSSNALYLCIAVCLVLYLIVQRPTKMAVLNDVPLSLEEEKLIIQTKK